MSAVLDCLAESDDEIDRDVAATLRHWQDIKERNGRQRRLGYEPRDFNKRDAVSVISDRVLKEATGFDEVDPEMSYEAIVLRYPARFKDDVVEFAKNRMQRSQNFLAQEIKFLIKTSSPELFGTTSVPETREAWVGRQTFIPRFIGDFSSSEDMIIRGFQSLVWFHEKPRKGEPGKGLTALVQFGPINKERHAEIIDADFFSTPVGDDVLKKHKNNDVMIRRIRGMNHSRIWPITQDATSILFRELQDKSEEIAKYNEISDDPFDPENTEQQQETTSVREVVVRERQAAFRSALISARAGKCAITGTDEIAVLEAAHIVPYSSGLPSRNQTQNGLLLRRDIHKLFDDGLISIHPESRKVVMSTKVKAKEYQDLQDITVQDPVSEDCLRFHFNKRKMD